MISNEKDITGRQTKIMHHQVKDPAVGFFIPAFPADVDRLG
jgi:hypothetical protein